MSAVVRHPRAVELVEHAKLRRKVARAVDCLIAILEGTLASPALLKLVLQESVLIRRDNEVNREIICSLTQD